MQSSYVLLNSDIFSQSASVGIILRMNPVRPDIFDSFSYQLIVHIHSSLKGLAYILSQRRSENYLYICISTFEKNIEHVFDALKRFEFHGTAYTNKNSIYSLEDRMLRNLFFMRNFFREENTSEVLKSTFVFLNFSDTLAINSYMQELLEKKNIFKLSIDPYEKSRLKILELPIQELYFTLGYTEECQNIKKLVFAEIMSVLFREKSPVILNSQKVSFMNIYFDKRLFSGFVTNTHQQRIQADFAQLKSTFIRKVTSFTENDFLWGKNFLNLYLMHIEENYFEKLRVKGIYEEYSIKDISYTLNNSNFSDFRDMLLHYTENKFYIGLYGNIEKEKAKDYFLWLDE
ncbi:MAG TPA: hypothetical protein PLM73_09380 [Petrotogaceae bacterium]|nr:hypothetical protein [Petrotogaceae bacterium]